MAVRTNDAAVRKLMDVPDDFDFASFMEAANSLVTNVCASHYVGNDTLLELIERWLAAHFATVFLDAAFLTVSQVGSIREQFESKVDLGLDVSKWGQQAMRLEYKGYLAAMNNAMKKQTSVLPGSGQTASISWLGTEIP